MSNERLTYTRPPTTRYQDEYAVVSAFIDELERRLAGRHEQRIVNKVPIDHCRLGVLAPWQQPSAETTVAEEQVDVDDGIAESSIPDIFEPEAVLETTHTPASLSSTEPAQAHENGGHSDERERGRRPPSSLGFEILLRPEDAMIELEVEARFAVYTRHLPTLQEQLTSLGGSSDSPVAGAMSLAEVCQRHEVIIPFMRFRLPAGTTATSADQGQVQRVLDQVLDRAAASPDALPNLDWVPKVPHEALRNTQQFSVWLEELVGQRPTKRAPLHASLEVRGDPLPDGNVRVSVYLRNNTDRAGIRREKRSEDSYNILGDARLRARLVQGDLQPVEILPIPEDYQYDRRVWGVGHNTSVAVSPDHRSLSTHALACYEQPRITTQSEPPTRFKDLALDPLIVLERIREAMLTYAEDWQRRIIDKNTLNLDAPQLAECHNDLTAFQSEIDRFACGIAALRTVPHLQQAFESMNRVMARLARDYDRWRLFQIVFIVTQLPALALREGYDAGEWPAGTPRTWGENLDVADVLWFPTGGGKTEAYLGLVSCAILYDRLRGKKLGITAWLRFPLRMLSIQQLQRAMRLIWETEQERLLLLGVSANESDPIRLGYFVGNPPTPNSLNREDMLRYQDVAAREQLRVIPDCPACGAKDSVRVEPEINQLQFKHICSACKVELPLVVTDSEVYRYLPALMVGTVDKMATVGLQPNFGLLWSGPRWRCPTHGYGYGEYCIVFGCNIKPRSRRAVRAVDPAPSLHIQDELHLLQEELGAFAGHYETLIRYCEEKASGRPAKIVAATATIEGFEHQVKHLYGVTGARRFPGRGYLRHENFYAALERDRGEPSSVHVQRMFVAFRPSGGNAADAAGLCAHILHDMIVGMIKDPYRSLAAMPGLNDIATLHDLLYYYSATLTYVGNLQSGTRVKDYLLEAGTSIYDRLRKLNIEYLSGRSTSGEVSEVIHRMEQPPSWAEQSHLDAIVATNMISHGVDLARVNLMVMDRFPAETAEYIQASSRSGRRKVGLVVVVLPSYSRRAASIYNRFPEFHEHLDRMVAPVPVNRFAKYAVHRTLPGAVSGLMFGLVGPTRKDPKEASNVRRRDAAIKMLLQHQERFLHAIKEAYGLGRGTYDPELEDAMAEAIEDRFEELLFILRGGHEDRLTEALRPRPMRSLRDVDPGIPFHPKRGDQTLNWFRKDGE